MVFPLALSDPLELPLEVPPWRLKGRGRSEVVRAAESPLPYVAIAWAPPLSEALVSGLAGTWEDSVGQDSGRPQCSPSALRSWGCGMAVMNGLLAG